MHASTIISTLQQAQTPQRKSLLNAYVRELLADFLGFDSLEEIAPNERFIDLGTDSLQAVGFKTKLETELDCALRTTLLFDHPRMDLLVDYLLDEVLPLDQVAAGAAANSADFDPAQPQNARPVQNQTIAIVAMAGQFPGADDAESLWRHTLTGDCLQLQPSQANGKFAYGHIGGQRSVDPAERQWQLLSALITQAQQHYQITEDSLSRLQTGVFVAAQSFQPAACSDQAYTVPIANRLSFELDLKGPSEVVNTFCTSVHVALHRALQSIRNGECRQAIVAAVNLIDDVAFNAAAEQGAYDNLLSIRNHTDSFGAEADGFVRSEGAGLVIVKPLAQALADGNQILALVKGSAVHHGGRGYSLEAPNVQGLKQAISDCLAQAGCSSDSIDYVEAHGIANPLADALELSAIGDAYQALSKQADKCWRVSTVKPSIGHPELASGMASLIKAVKALQQHEVPGIAGFRAANRELPAGLGLILQSQASEWQHDDGPRRAALNSYAIGGVNAHIVLEEYCGQLPADDQVAPLPAVSVETLPISTPSELNLDVEAVLAGLSQEVFGMALADIDRSQSPVHYGFDSIQVVQFINRLNEGLGFDLKVAQAMGCKNFGEFFRLVARQQPDPERLALVASAELQAVPTTPQALSETQKGLWYIQQSYPESCAFNVPLIFRLSAAPDPEYLHQALLAMLERRPMLRCRYRYQQDAIEQSVTAVADNVYIEQLQLAEPDEAEALMRDLLRRSFDLAQDAPLRMYSLACPQQQRHWLFFVFHHIVIDGFSGMLFANEFWQAYHALAAGQTLEPQAVDTAFFDFVAWEQRYLQSAQAAADLAYWKQQLAGHSASLALPYDTLPQPGLADLGMGCQTLTLDSATFAALKYLAGMLNQNLSALLLGVFNLLLYRLSGEDDIAVNMPTAGRPLQRHQNTVGCYINLMVLRSQIRPEESFLQLVKQIGGHLAEGLDHAHFPFAKIMPELGLTLLNPNEVPFSVSFTYQNIFDAVLDNSQTLGDAELSFEVYQETMDSYMLEVYDFRDQLKLHLKYQRNLFRDDSIQRHLAYLQNLIAAVVEDPSMRLDEYDCLPEDEVELLLEGFNDTGREFAKHSHIYAEFAAQAARSPEQTALIFAGQAISYAELAQRSRQLAIYLQSQNIVPQQMVAVCMDRSADMVIAVLGILAAGAAYLPIDPHNAEDRIRYILQDAQVKLLLTQAHLLDKLQSLLADDGCRCLALDDAAWAQGQGAAKLIDCAGPELPAYLIYTSGSTGQPKGVQVSQRSLLNLCRAMQETYAISSQDRMLQFASLSFDMSVEEIFPYLLAGAGVVIRQDADIEVDNFYRLVVDNAVNMLNIPPQFYSVIAALDAEQQQCLFEQLRLIAFGGEALPEATLQAVQGRGVEIFNAYGPTEYTVNAAIADLSSERTLTIGKPIANTRLYVLNPQLDLQPIGVAGELHIAGEGLALGYLNNSQLTAEKFIDNPYALGKLYKTGDLARWLPDGRIAFLGRTDHQVKLRGFRVELGEIENALCAVPGVNGAAVVLVGGDRLAAYYSSQAEDLNGDDLREQLKHSLPDYMLPALFCRQDSLPLTRNGKIDRKQLEQRPLEFEAESDYAAPETESQRQLARIWQNLLNYQPLGLDDNFFALGGHSLLSIQMVHEVNRQLAGADIGVADIVRCPTVRQLAELIGQPVAQPSRSPYLLNLSDSIPAFIVPGMPGLSDGYHELATAIGNGAPVYGLQMKGYAGSPPATSVQEMAVHNIEQIKAVKARGAIKLYAHSYGGSVAYEMVKQLQGSGLTVDELVLIDSGVANWPKRLDADSVMDFLNMIMANAGIAPAEHQASIARILAEQPYAVWKTELAQWLSAVMGLQPDYFLSLWQVVEAALAVDYQYPHGKLAQKAVLVVAAESKGWLKPDSWDAYFDEVKVLEAEGGHYSLVAEPYCAEWLRTLCCRSVA